MAAKSATASVEVRAKTIIDDLVYFLRRDAGEYHFEGSDSLTNLSNTVPAIGDRITLTRENLGGTTMEVVGRHYVRHLNEASDTEWAAWFIIVGSLELDGNLFDAICENFR